MKRKAREQDEGKDEEEAEVGSTESNDSENQPFIPMPTDMYKINRDHWTMSIGRSVLHQVAQTSFMNHTVKVTPKRNRPRFISLVNKMANHFVCHG